MKKIDLENTRIRWKKGKHLNTNFLIFKGATTENIKKFRTNLIQSDPNPLETLSPLPYQDLDLKKLDQIPFRMIAPTTRRKKPQKIRYSVPCYLPRLTQILKEISPKWFVGTLWRESEALRSFFKSKIILSHMNVYMKTCSTYIYVMSSKTSL